MIPSLQRIGLLCVGSFFLTGCVAASNWLAGPTQSENSQFDASPHNSPLQIGVTTKEEIVSKFGKPTNHYIHSIDGIDLQSLSYSTTNMAITPFQYFPLLGAIAFLKPFANERPSIALSFSSDQRVSGLTESTVNAYGDIRSSNIFPTSDSSTSFFGMRNPQVFHSQVDSTP